MVDLTLHAIHDSWFLPSRGSKLTGRQTNGKGLGGGEHRHMLFVVERRVRDNGGILGSVITLLSLWLKGNGLNGEKPLVLGAIWEVIEPTSYCAFS